MKKVLKALLCLLAVLLLTAAGYVVYVFTSYYRIGDHLSLAVEQGTENASLETGTTYKAVTYNIGFGAYTPDFTFFMDGGKSSWAKSKESVIETVGGAIGLLAEEDPDLMLIEEVDFDSTRSYHVDQLAMLREAFPDRDLVFAVNYDSPFLMYPFTQPHGKSRSGIAMFSRFDVSEAERRSLPISESVSKLVDLDRCYSVSRLPVQNGKELIVYTVHLSAYGHSDAVREGQKRMLMEDMKEEYDAGNYVICGGDWNHELRETEADSAFGWAQPFPREYVPEGFDFAPDLLPKEERDALADTCRNCDVPYEPSNEVFTVDGFMISDNVRLVEYHTIDTQYLWSDHNPVELVFELAD